MAGKKKHKGDELSIAMLRGIIMTCIYIVPFTFSVKMCHRFLPSAVDVHFKAIMGSSCNQALLTIVMSY